MSRNHESHRISVRLVPLTLALLLTLVACSGASTTTTQGATDTTSSETTSTTATTDTTAPDSRFLRIATSTEIRYLDPHLEGGTTSISAIWHMFDRLVIRSADGNTHVGQLATNWVPIDDVTWEFTIRDDVVFHDGEPLTAEDVKASFDRLIAIQDADVSSLANSWQDLVRVDVVDDYTVRIITTAPKADILMALELVAIGPAHLMDEDSYLDTLVGSGPFKFVEWRPGEILIMETNADYWGGAPQIAGIEFHEIPETSSQVTALLAGDLDIMPGLPPDSIATVEDNPGTHVIANASWQRYYIRPNHFMEVFQDVRVRHALWYSMDLEEIAASLFSDYASVMRGPVSQAALGAIDLGTPTFDPDLARDLLAEAGYDESNPLSVELAYVSGDGPLISDIAILVAANWQAIGVDVTIAEQDEATNAQALEDRSSSLQLTPNSGNPGNVAGSDGRNFHSSYPLLGFSNPEIDAIIDAARVEVDLAAQTELWNEFQRKAWELAPYLYMFELAGVFGVSDEVGDFVPGPNTTRADLRGVTLAGS
jgi:peptide/nickel transport system substrate-binding protein